MDKIYVKELFSHENMFKRPLSLIKKGILNDFERLGIMKPQKRLIFKLDDPINLKYAHYSGLDTVTHNVIPEIVLNDTEFSPWSILKNIKENIQNDYVLLSEYNLLKQLPEKDRTNGIFFGDPDLVKTWGENVTIHKGVVLDTTNGPIVLGDSVVLYPFSIIEGPAYIGDRTEIKSARISGGVLIGKTCKISGEISNSVMGDYSNKTHEGLVANSYVGDWCNLGGYTNTACLKTDYSDIIVKYRDNTYETGTNKFGAVIGDFVRVGGGITIMPGTFIDICTTIVQLPLLKGYIRPFTKVVPGLKFSMEDFTKEMQMMMDRRNIKISHSLMQYWESVYDHAPN
ncbi:hypothetical protein EGY07_18815 [Chryseobacterium indologenes]|uniref:hypothetical protein n=1 Tax=Chryseobacterium indologenes TaxID=253 RepID=UPI000F4E0B27|nr:hypothetical protein [Chryseobacterium indologenes]AYZ37440.1 hypothetical protein EGY07_18815 [Chryseobacterium indologenes]MBF6646311.1 hypothetical protein [Chryseobacterium indologenes]MEB4761743.1 hypothetical protein [Chryseobacterium indologenes]QQQ70016.1 hypothetical protein JHW31_16100 [Chryseobacterium indologenes]